MSVSTFQRRWNEAMGITPARYALGLRLQEACRLLIETSDSISEVANDCGFEDEFFFHDVSAGNSAYRRTATARTTSSAAG
jgi:transcriptional regulator GlxA family with amidase domain